MKYTFTLLLVLSSLIGQAKDQKGGFELSGDILEYAMPAMALSSTFVWNDGTRPTWQFLKSMGTALGTAYLMKQIVHKPRPDNTEWVKRYDSFPSGHTTSAFTSAAFMERRYGWKVGVPAYVVAGYVGWSRVHSDRHDWWDVLGGAFIGTTASYLFTKKHESEDLDLSLNVLPNNYSFGFIYRF